MMNILVDAGVASGKGVAVVINILNDFGVENIALFAGSAVISLFLGGVIGFIIGIRTQGDSGSETIEPTEATESIGKINHDPAVFIDAINKIVAEARLIEREIVDQNANPSTQATAILRAADQNKLIPPTASGSDASPGGQETTGSHDDVSVVMSDTNTTSGGNTRTKTTEGTETTNKTVSALLANAVETASARTDPRTDTANRLLRYLEATNNTAERRLTDTLTTAVERIERDAETHQALSTVRPHVEPEQLAQTLQQKGVEIDGDAGSAITIIGERLADVVTDRDECHSTQASMVTSIEKICNAVREQAGESVSADPNTNPDLALDEITTALTNEEVAFTTALTDINTVIERAAISPQSSRSQSLIDVIRADDVAASRYAETLQSAVTAIDEAAVTADRLEGVETDSVAELAGSLVTEFQKTDAAIGKILADRAAELESTVSQAGPADRVSVYAARQELRFYDRTLCPELQSPTGESSGLSVQTLAEEIESRRSTLRTEYPSEYPTHDHSIPIHFLELVSSLQEAANDARAAGNTDRAIGYLQAADETLDWVMELYERQAYSVLLEQLRG